MVIFVCLRVYVYMRVCEGVCSSAAEIKRHKNQILLQKLVLVDLLLPL